MGAQRRLTVLSTSPPIPWLRGKETADEAMEGAVWYGPHGDASGGRELGLLCGFVARGDHPGRIESGDDLASGAGLNSDWPSNQTGLGVDESHP